MVWTLFDMFGLICLADPQFIYRKLNFIGPEVSFQTELFQLLSLADGSLFEKQRVAAVLPGSYLLQHKAMALLSHWDVSREK